MLTSKLLQRRLLIIVMKKNDNICKECGYFAYDALCDPICTNPVRGGDVPIISEYMPACFRFINK